MKTLLFLALLATARAGTFTANVVLPTLTSSPGSSYSLGGLTFTSTTGSAIQPFYPAGIQVDNTGWLQITATNGNPLLSADLIFSFDWDTLAILTGGIVPTFEAVAISAGQPLFDQNTGPITRGGGFTYANPAGFDSLLIRSTASIYQVLYSDGHFVRGPLVSATDRNLVALTDITAVIDPPEALGIPAVSAPEPSATAALLTFALGAMVSLKAFARLALH